MADPTFQRARSSAAKDARVEAIFRSAREQATARSVREVTLTDIAAGVGMHKSTMLRYFETREEIFLRLAAQEWVDWSEAAVRALVEPNQRDGPDRPAAESVAQALAASLVARPLFCDLLANAPLSLERGVSMGAVKDFKLVALSSARAVAEALRSILPLDHDGARNVVATATGMAGALWQMAAPGTQLRRLYETDPELGHAIVDVGPRLAAILEALVHGSAATRSPTG